MKCSCSMMPSNVKIIKVGDSEVGIIDLEKTMREVYFLKIGDEDAVKAKLLEKIKTSNFIPPARELLYSEALLREYRSYVERRYGEKSVLTPPVKQDSPGFLKFLRKFRRGKLGKK